MKNDMIIEFEILSQCEMIDTVLSHGQYLNLTGEYFPRVDQQDEDPDLFTAVRRSVISYVETAPLKSCDQGWVYDHSLVASTITSEVRHNPRILLIHEKISLILLT